MVILGRSVYLTIFLANLTMRLTSSPCITFACNWRQPSLNQRKGENDRRNYFMSNLHESMGPDRDRTCDPWICSRHISAARNVTGCATRTCTGVLANSENPAEVSYNVALHQGPHYLLSSGTELYHFMKILTGKPLNLGLKVRCCGWFSRRFYSRSAICSSLSWKAMKRWTLIGIEVTEYIV